MVSLNRWSISDSWLLLRTISFSVYVCRCLMCSFLSFWIFWSRLLMAASCCFLKALSFSSKVYSSAISFSRSYLTRISSIYCWTSLALSYSCTFTRFLIKARSTSLYAGALGGTWRSAFWKLVILLSCLRTPLSQWSACPGPSWPGLLQWLNSRSWTGPIDCKTPKTLPFGLAQSIELRSRTKFWGICSCATVSEIWSLRSCFCYS